MQGVEGGSFAQVIGYSPQANRVWRFSFADPSHADAFFALHVDGHGKTFRKEFYAGCFREYSDSFPDIGVFFETRENCDTVTVSDRYSYGVGVYWDIAVKNFFEFKTYLVFFTRTAGGVDLADKRDKIGAYWEGEGFGFEHRVIEVVKCAGARSRNCLICTNVNFFQREDAVQRCKAYSRLYG